MVDSMEAVSDTIDHWEDDLLGFRDLGTAYTNLIASLEDSRTISIEAGFGHGKTFFRERWAKQLTDAGELVVEIDAKQSDHSGDPVLTFLGALIDLVPKQESETRKKAIAAGKKIGSVFAKTITKAVLREGADEFVGLFADENPEESTLESIATEVGNSMSKLAGDMLATQMATEKVRKEEVPAQLRSLHGLLTNGRDTKRIVVLIDELDRCHPEYAITLLEAMKLVFNEDGFVFVLLVNDDYLEGIATHRFGRSAGRESYIEKFVDLRLGLPAKDDKIGEAAFLLAAKLPLEVPFGDGHEFTVERTAELAKLFVPKSGLSMRQIKRVFQKIDLVLRCYRSRPIDLPLLTGMGLVQAQKTLKEYDGQPLLKLVLPRFELSPDNANGVLTQTEDDLNWGRNREPEKMAQFVHANCKELATLPRDRYRLPDANTNYYPSYLVLNFLAPHYQPEHEAMLNAVQAISVDQSE